MLIPILIKGYDTLFVTLICPKLDFPLLFIKFFDKVSDSRYLLSNEGIVPSPILSYSSWTLLYLHSVSINKQAEKLKSHEMKEG